MRWEPVGLIVAVAVSLAAAGSAQAAQSPTGWDGTNPFRCTLQQAGFEAAVPDPAADPYCVEFDKRRQNVSELGVVQFLLQEPARVAAAVPKCFYFQSDHWRGSFVQDDETTKTYEYDGHYFFDKARGEGGAWVTNFNINGRTSDPSQIPGIPSEFSRHFGPGTGGVITRNEIDADPACIERAADPSRPVYAAPPAGDDGPGAAPVARCPTLAGTVSRTRLASLRLRDPESRVRAQLGAPVRVHRGYLRYCLSARGKVLVGQRGDRSGTRGTDPDTPTALLLTTSPAVKVARVRPGSSSRTVRRRFPRRVRRVRVGRTTFFESSRRSGVLLGLRDGRLRYVGVYDRSAIRTTAGLRSFLRRAG